MDDDARAEQNDELEALEAIFGSDYQVLEEASDHSGARFQINLMDDAGIGEVKVRLIFTHMPAYPREPLKLVVHALSGVPGPKRKALQAVLEGAIEQNVDMPAVFTICEAARDWLAENITGGGQDDGDETTEEIKFETLDATARDQVEVISQKAVGLPVTVESFAEWRDKFMMEMAALKTKEQLERELETSLTGREFFESRTVVVSAESESFWEAEASHLASVDDA